MSGNLSADTLDVRQINCPNLAVGLTQDVVVTVNPGATNANNTFVNNGVFTSLQTCIESIPKNLNGYHKFQKTLQLKVLMEELFL